MKGKKQDSKLKEEQEEVFVNPIDKDKIAENPHLLPYAHTVGGAIIKPIDKGRMKGLAMAAMYDQADNQMDQIREQIELLAAQARKIQDRVKISEDIYESEMNFKPIIGKTYHLYKKSEDKRVLSMIGPKEWGKNSPYEFIASITLLADHTWKVVDPT